MGGVLIHVCAKIATAVPVWTAWVLIHACARIATGFENSKSWIRLYFNSCMREDCNPPGGTTGQVLTKF